MKKVIIVIGTRPEAIKMAPVYLELKSRKMLSVKICSTGQHKEILNSALNHFGIAADDNLELDYSTPNISFLLQEIIKQTSVYLEKELPDLVLVHGDTTTTLGAALAASYLDIPVGHVEAGLRTFDKKNPWPEEINRQLVSRLSKYNYCPTNQALENLKSERIDLTYSLITGNTVIDAARITSQKSFDLRSKSDVKIILVTLHRRENQGKIMKNILGAIKSISQKYQNQIKIILPVHPNPKVKKIVINELNHIENILLTTPKEYGEFVGLLRSSYIILTDSGGIQEEAPFFNVPVLVLRKTTERPEAISAGVAKLVGVDKENIINEFSCLFDNEVEYKKMSMANNPFGDGFAAKTIVNHLENNL